MTGRDSSALVSAAMTYFSEVRREHINPGNLKKKLENLERQALAFAAMERLELIEQLLALTPEIDALAVNVAASFENLPPQARTKFLELSPRLAAIKTRAVQIAATEPPIV